MSPCSGRSSNMTRHCRGFWPTKSPVVIRWPPASCGGAACASATARSGGSQPPTARPIFRSMTRSAATIIATNSPKATCRCSSTSAISPQGVRSRWRGGSWRNCPASRRGQAMSRTDRTSFLRRAVLLAALAISCAAGGAAPRPDSVPAKLAGAFVNWGSVGRERTLQDWEKWLNQKPSSVIAVDFYGETTWEEFAKYTWVPGVWKKLIPARKVVWSMPLTMKGTPLTDVAAGKYDLEFEGAARAIADAQPDAVIRLGWEMNLEQSNWFAGGREAGYIAAYRHVVGLFRKASHS